MKKIIFSIASNGVDGLEHKTIYKAFFDEKERDNYLKIMKNSSYFYPLDEIVDIEKETSKSRNKLNGIDKLLLGINND